MAEDFTAEAQRIAQESLDQQAKTAEAVQNDSTTIQSEQTVTSDTTTSVEKPGKKPAQAKPAKK